MSKRISVVIASYNGAKYIEEQLNTILNQLSDDDEIIISDDGSVDGTIEKIKNINDARIKLIEGPHKGVKANFNNGLKECEGKYIFLCDQDDIWTGNKVDICLKYLKDHDLVVHDAVVVNSDDSEVIED